MDRSAMNAVRMVDVGWPLVQSRIEVREPQAGEVRVRIEAAGICHSDAHYRAGASPMGALPLTLGHEIAGVVEAIGSGVAQDALGDRVCLHYLLTCGRCAECEAGREQFCERGAMLGHHVDGGFAEWIVVPERNAVRLPAEISFEVGAILMCSSATALHALRKARLRAGESVAVFGVGGLGISAVQIANILGAREVYAVDVKSEKLALAARHGAIGIPGGTAEAVAEIRRRTSGRGVDVALELVGRPDTMRQALQVLAPLGRAVVAGLGVRSLEIDPYVELMGREAELIGTNDHLLTEVVELVELARCGKLDLGDAITQRVPLEAGAINQVLDDLDHFRGGVRAVIVPGR
jgi:propanol-preferring alcohol dehydrogenase